MKERSFRVYVEKDYLKFNAAHFIAYRGFREALHGHNYRVSVEVEGELGAQGYVLDFGIVKDVAKRVCNRLNEKTLIPMRSDCLTIREEGSQVVLNYEQDEFRFPKSDCLMLPIVHSSAEELAQFLAGEMRRELATEKVDGITAIEVGVAETPGQAAYCRETL
ncbi:MAG: 6-carboxytetrahydropterin synthase [Deltaproteobacteria bacterium]|nr:6-carboxytetrahydropterin synthase [Deltaproteobacteria bacterium]